MIKLAVIAGNQTASLVQHLNKGGAFSVDFSFNSLEGSQSKIKTAIINVDKLLYVYIPSDVNIRNEMSILQELLTSDTFFTTSEILFLQKQSDVAKQAEDYFNSVMKECNRINKKTNKVKDPVNYSIQTLETNLTFTSISNYLLGTLHNDDVHNTITEFYRKEKDNDAVSAYSPKNTSKHKVEPFDFIRIENFNAEKQVAEKLDSGVKRETSDSDVIDILDNPYFGKLDEEALYEGTNVFLLSGGNKTGKTTWAMALAASAFQAGTKTLLIDLTRNQHLDIQFDAVHIPYNYLTYLELIRLSGNLDGNLTICTATTKEEQKVSKEFMQLLFASAIERFKVHNVIILIEAIDFEHYYKSLKSVIAKVFYCAHPIIDDLQLITDRLNEISKDTDTTLILNKNVMEFSNGTLYDPDDKIKRLFSSDLKVVAPINFTTFNIDSSIYKTLMEV